MSENPCGGCLCAATRFEILATPRWIAHCHCASCRRSTGAPLTTYIGLDTCALHFTSDTRRLFASSPGVLRGFCAHCGSPLSYQSERWPGEVHVHVSAMDRPQLFAPRMHVYYAERIAWLELHDDLPRFDAAAGRGAVASSHGPVALGKEGRRQ